MTDQLDSPGDFSTPAVLSPEVIPVPVSPEVIPVPVPAARPPRKAITRRTAAPLWAYGLALLAAAACVYLILSSTTREVSSVE